MDVGAQQLRRPPPRQEEDDDDDREVHQKQYYLTQQGGQLAEEEEEEDGEGAQKRDVDRGEDDRQRRRRRHRKPAAGNVVDGAPLLALNHVSRLCKSVEASIDFYTNVLGFVLVERPPAFDTFAGAWLFNYGVGIHLVQKEEHGRQPTPTSDASPEKLDPMDNHISFQCEDMAAMEGRLREKGVEYLKRTVEKDEDEGEAASTSEAVIDQLFFNDPDGFMIEICNCENVELVPARPPSAGRIRLPRGRHNPPVNTAAPGSNADGDTIN